MRKYLPKFAIVGFLLFVVGTAIAMAQPTTLYEYYNSNLPSVSQRSTAATECGIQNYTGTAEQNKVLLDCLVNGKSDLGALSGFPPSRYKTTLAQSFGSTMATTTRMAVSSLTLPSGETLASDDVGNFTVLTINPGAGNEEKLVCQGISSTSTAWIDCRRGLSYKDGTSRQENVKVHSPGETVIISDDFQFFDSEMAFLDRVNTFNNDQKITTSTASISRFYVFDDNHYIWARADGIGFASTTNSEFAFNTDGSLFTAIPNLTLSGGELKIATSSLWFVTRDSTLAIATTTGSGFVLAWDNLLNSTTTADNMKFASTTLTGNTLFTNNATTSGSLYSTGELWGNGLTHLNNTNFNGSVLSGTPSTTNEFAFYLSEALKNNIVTEEFYRGSVVYGSLAEVGAGADLNGTSTVGFTLTLPASASQSINFAPDSFVVDVSERFAMVMNAKLTTHSTHNLFFGLGCHQSGGCNDLNGPWDVGSNGNGTGAGFVAYADDVIEAFVGNGSGHTTSSNLWGTFTPTVSNTYKIVKADTNYLYYINDKLVATLSSNLPTGTLAPAFAIGQNASAAASISFGNTNIANGNIGKAFTIIQGK